MQTVNGKYNTTIYKYVFQYKDHLGNIRVNFSKDVDGLTKILEENQYYPFGLKHTNYNSDKYGWIRKEDEDFAKIKPQPGGIVAGGYKYKYNGKELQDELGLNMYDYGARNYDPALGRWMNIDPLAEKFNQISPYTYVANNPLIYIDPDGKELILAGDKKNVDRTIAVANQGIGSKIVKVDKTVMFQ